MHPIICTIGPFTIYSYGVILAIAFITASALLTLQAKKNSFNPDIIFNFSFLVFFCGIIGARLLYIIENAAYYLKEPLEITMLQHGGLSWFGGLLAGLIVGLVYLKRRNLPVYKILDLVAPFLALAQAIGRIGCFLNGCCFGTIFNFIPTQLYSSLILTLIFLLLRFLQDRPHQEGKIFFLYLLLYSAKRFFIEFWRADNPVIFLSLTLFQLISIVVFTLSAIKLFLIKRPHN
jgi:phosphatidylglycerol:prolipoprotein diacylglycerol transferase